MLHDDFVDLLLGATVNFANTQPVEWAGFNQCQRRAIPGALPASQCFRFIPLRQSGFLVESRPSTRYRSGLQFEMWSPDDD
jgi:hypothetical protein